MANLEEYAQKHQFDRTPEPLGDEGGPAKENCDRSGSVLLSLTCFRQMSSKSTSARVVIVGELWGNPSVCYVEDCGSKGIPRQKLAVFNPATYGTSVRASNGARKAIKKFLGEDLMEWHRVMKRNRGTAAASSSSRKR